MKKGSIVLGLILVMAVIGGFYWLFGIRFRVNGETVSGIVYDMKKENWPVKKTTFKIRAAKEMAVTEDTSPTYCLPEGSEYEGLIEEAAKNKDVRVVVEKQPFSPRWLGWFACDGGNTIVTRQDNE